MIRVFDGHSDIFSDITNKRSNGEKDVIRTHHLSRLRSGGTEGGIFVIWVDPPYTDNPGKRTDDIMESVSAELKESEDVSIVKCFDDIGDAVRQNKFYILCGIEGLSAIGCDISLIDKYYEFGCRHAMLTWNEENALATGVRGNPDRGLTEIGKKAVRKIQDHKMILDVSHLNERSFWDVMRCSAGPVIASHSNCRALCNELRNLTDEQIIEIGRTEGVIGLNAYAPFVDADSNGQTVEKLCVHAMHIIDLIGVEHLACGFDFFEFLENNSSDSIFDTERLAVNGMENSSKVQNLFTCLKNAGLSDDELEMIGYKNWHRIIKVLE